MQSVSEIGYINKYAFIMIARIMSSRMFSFFKRSICPLFYYEMSRIVLLNVRRQVLLCFVAKVYKRPGAWGGARGKWLSWRPVIQPVRGGFSVVPPVVTGQKIHFQSQNPPQGFRPRLVAFDFPLSLYLLESRSR